MAVIPEDDDLRYGLRGKWGDVVFRRVYGKTVMSRKPGKQDPAKQSEARKKVRSTFKDAAAWAVQVRRDPEKKAYYNQLAREWGLTNGYIAAIKDYMRNSVSSFKCLVTSSTQGEVCSAEFPVSSSATVSGSELVVLSGKISESTRVSATNAVPSPETCNASTRNRN
jgi:hypothetical protein